MGVLILNEGELKRALAEVDAIDAVEHAFATLALGKANLPGVISLEIPEKEGEYHIKGAYLEGAPYVVFKSANSYYRNPEKGLPSSAGLFLAFDAETGFLSALMFDNSLLTHARTGAAGAVAAKYLAKENVEHASSATAAVDDVYAAYRQWATRDGRNPLNKSNMLKELYELFPEAARVREGGGQRRWLIRGLRLNEQGADALTGSAFD